MGPFNGGGFGGSSGDAFSSSGSSGAFGSSSDQHRHDNVPISPYNDPYYYNNQRPYRESRSYGSGGHGGGVGGGRVCSIFLSFFSFVGSLWLLFGLFKADQLELGLSSSRLINANSVFVKQVQLRNLRDPGPVVYSFSKRPVLSDSVVWTETHDISLEAINHHEWGFWLNKGSSINLTYDVKGLTQDYLVLAFIRGREGLEDWIRAPDTPAKTLKWYRIHGTGIKDFKADSNDEYFVAFGNLNRQDIQFSGQFDIFSTLYSTKDAEKKTEFTVDTETINLAVPLFGSSLGLVTTPSKPQDGVDVWELQVVYSTRWTTYLILWGLLVFGLVTLCCFETVGFSIWRRSREELPLLAPRDEQASHSPASSYPPSLSSSSPPGEVDENGERTSNEQLCTVCLDAPKDSFFDPCGHRCSCYPCGKRIQRGNRPICPICRQPIRTVRKIFDS